MIKPMLMIAIVSFLISIAFSRAGADPLCNGTKADTATRCTPDFQQCLSSTDECSYYNTCDDNWLLELLGMHADIRKQRKNNASKPRNCIAGASNEYCHDLPVEECYAMSVCYQVWVLDHYECNWGQDCEEPFSADVVENLPCQQSE